MPLERLETPYELINAPVTLWQQYPILIISVANLILLLLGMLLFQSVSLRRTKLAHAKVAASEKQVRESEARYRLLASNTKDVISTWNTATRSISYCSPSIQALTGFTPAEYMATPLAESMTAESFSQARQLMGNGSTESQVLEIEMYTKDGGYGLV
ncbi:MAG: PAS domain-containing protein [Proteobacteria bacterium]|nr:PAS domain-containing protein [Pseudomonadota bacterium]